MPKLTVVVFASACHVSITWAQVQASPSPASQLKDYSDRLIGSAKMEMESCWRREESIHDVMYHTFSNQIRLMLRNPTYFFWQHQTHVIPRGSCSQFAPNWEIFLAWQENRGSAKLMLQNRVGRDPEALLTGNQCLR